MKFRTKYLGNKTKSALVLLFLLLLNKTVFAVQELGQFGEGAGTPAEKASTTGTLDLMFYALIIAVVIECAAIILLAISISKLIKVYFGVELKALKKKEETEEKAEEAKAPVKKKWFSFERINQTVPIEREGELIMKDHEYDGIHELDNKMPPWFIWLFNVTIVFALGYLLVYHVFRTSPLQIDEYKNELAVADKQMEEVRKKSANLVDENNVTLLTEADKIKAGATLYTTNCVACHGAKGEGGVGPNLTDEYWLHGGSVKNIFKTIKYGVPEKGMKSWQQDISPSQMQEVVSYIKTLKGTNPPNAKEKQGELYSEEADGATDAKSDTVKAGKM